MQRCAASKHLQSQQQRLHAALHISENASGVCTLCMWRGVFRPKKRIPACLSAKIVFDDGVNPSSVSGPKIQTQAQSENVIKTRLLLLPSINLPDPHETHSKTIAKVKTDPVPNKVLKPRRKAIVHEAKGRVSLKSGFCGVVKLAVKKPPIDTLASLVKEKIVSGLDANLKSCCCIFSL